VEDPKKTIGWHLAARDANWEELMSGRIVKGYYVRGTSWLSCRVTATRD